MEPVMCKTCKTTEAEDGQVRCRGCHAAFRRWLDGGAVYQPQFDGVQSEESPHERHRVVAFTSLGGKLPVDYFIGRMDR